MLANNIKLLFVFVGILPESIIYISEKVANYVCQQNPQRDGQLLLCNQQNKTKQNKTKQNKEGFNKIYNITNKSRICDHTSTFFT